MSPASRAHSVTLALALALLSAGRPALAQEEEPTAVQTMGTECDQNAVPIAGTSGYANAREALRTTAQTYSAASYAEEHLFPLSLDVEKGGSASFEFFQMLAASRFPANETNAGNAPTCPEEYRVSMRALDLQAMVLGLSFRSRNWGFFYAASVAYGNPAMPNNYVRGMLLGAQPIYATTVLGLAPLWRNGFSTQQGASAFALDWVAGATYDSPLLGFRAGYAGSRGLYGSLADKGIGLFLSGMLGGQDRGGGLLGFGKAGLDRAEADEVVEGAGLTSVYARDLPYGVEPAEEVVEEEPPGLFGEAGRLTTGHVEQANLFGVLDLGAAYAFRPVPQLSELTFAVHSRGYVPTRDGEGPEPGLVWMLRGGPVWIPGSALIGLESGERYHLRGEVGYRAGEGHQAFTFTGAFLMNDPELLALYPYAVDAPTVRLHLDGGF